MNIELTDRELAHVLLGLRMQQIDGCFLPPQMQEAERTLIYDEGFTGMTDSEIDDLCERINCR